MRMVEETRHCGRGGGEARGGIISSAEANLPPLPGFVPCDDKWRVYFPGNRVAGNKRKMPRNKFKTGFTIDELLKPDKEADKVDGENEKEHSGGEEETEEIPESVNRGQQLCSSVDRDGGDESPAPLNLIKTTDAEEKLPSSSSSSNVSPTSVDPKKKQTPPLASLHPTAGAGLPSWIFCTRYSDRPSAGKV